MRSKRRVLKRDIKNNPESPYLSAIRNFTQMTIHDPSFFDKTPEEQKAIAHAMLQEQKEGKNRRALKNDE